MIRIFSTATLTRPLFLGEKANKEILLKKIKKNKIKCLLPDYNRTHELPSMAHIGLACAKYFKVKENEIYVSKRGMVNEPKMIAIYSSRVWASKKPSDIAEQYNCHNHSSISNAVKRLDERIQREKKFKKLIREIHDIIM